MKKRYLKLCLTIVLSISMIVMTACGGNDAAGSEEDVVEDNGTTVSEAPTDPPTETDKGSDAYDQSKVSEHAFTLGHVMMEGSTMQYQADLLNELIQIKSDGKMSVEIYGSSTLGSDESMAADVQAGSLDFEIAGSQGFTNIVPETSIYDMPFLFNTVEEGRAVNNNEEFYKTLSAKFEEKGMILYPVSDEGFRNMTTNTEITGLDSLKGLPFRTTPNENHQAIFTALGMAVVPLSTSEMFMALQQGMVDGQENPWSQIYDKGLWEVQKYVTNSQHVMFIGVLVGSKATMDSLTETERQIIYDAAAESVPYLQSHTDKFEGYSLELLIDKGFTYTDFDKISGLRDELREKTFEPLYKKISGKIGDSAILDEYIRLAGYTPPAN